MFENLPPRKVFPSGPENARILILGEAPGVHDIANGRPFLGSAGEMLDRMLLSAGISREACRLTTLTPYQPKDNNIDNFFYTVSVAKSLSVQKVYDRYPSNEILYGLQLLQEEIIATRPAIIIALGDAALWALTGLSSISKYRGSILKHVCSPHEGRELSIPVIATHPPESVIRNYGSFFPVSCLDLRRAKSILDNGLPLPPSVEKTVITSTEQLSDWITSIPPDSILSCDIETKRQHIACCGLAYFSDDTYHCMSLPIFTANDMTGLWPDTQSEHEVISLLRNALHSFSVIGQNFSYDMQYLSYHWGVRPDRVISDTMIAHHLCYPLWPKSLDFLSSIYSPYPVFWKDDGKDWNEHLDEHQLLNYNMEDCFRTLECHFAIQSQIDQMGLRDQHTEQMQFWRCALRAMLRGVQVSRPEKRDLLTSLIATATEMELWLERAIPRGQSKAPWWTSPQQQLGIIKDIFRIKPVINRKTGRPTMDSDALPTLAKREPLFAPIAEVLTTYRSLANASTFLQKRVDCDNRMRCQYNIAGTGTFRLSSSESAFSTGTNLQNITSGREIHGITIPNLRRVLVPDPGYHIFDIDLERADAQVVAWEANDIELMEIFRTGADIHTENAKAIGCTRKQAKAGVHAVNYGVQARTLASTLGITVHEAEKFIRTWLSAHPAIADWHRRVESTMNSDKTLTSAFGYKVKFFDRASPQLFHEMLAWVPQHTVAIVINQAWHAIDQIPEAQVLLQVHDSLVFQLHASHLHLLPKIRRACSVAIPYPDPLVIPVGLKCSFISWGDVETPEPESLIYRLWNETSPTG